MAGGKLVKKALDFLKAHPEFKLYKGGSFSLERQGVYNPKYFDLKKDDLVDEAGNIIASKNVAVPREGFSYDLPAQADPNKIFRGMSAEEFANFQKNKYIQSLGTHNIGEGQKGLTYFSVNPDEARSYAHSFAPSDFKPDPSRPAYVVAAKRPPDESIARVPGTGESEVGVMGQIPREDVTNVYRGNVVDYIEGIDEPNAKISPSSSVYWEEINDYADGGFVEQRSGFAEGGGTGKPMTIDEIIARIRSGEAQLGEFDPRIPQLDANRAFQPPGSKFSNQALPILPTRVIEPEPRIAESIPMPPMPPMPPSRPAEFDSAPSEPRPVTINRQAPSPTADDNVSRALWEIYNQTESPADFLRADAAMRAERAGGGKAVQKALRAVSELFDSPGMEKWREGSKIPASRVEDRYFTGTSKDKDFANFNVGRHGAWFTKDPADASMYARENDSKGYRAEGWNMVPVNTADRVIPAFLRSENPFTGPLPDMARAQNYKKAQSDWFDQLRSQGHDAWMPESDPNLAVILRDPSNIKSAISNTGEFDRASPRVDRASGGHVLSDDYPTSYMPNVGRQVMAGGGDASTMGGFMPPPADASNLEQIKQDRYLDALLASMPQKNVDIENYERTRSNVQQQPEAIRQMTHMPNKPMRPIEIEGGLIGKRQLGSAPYDVAGPLSSSAQFAYDMKSLPVYLTPAAPFALASDTAEAGINMAKSINKGDYLGAGIEGALNMVPGAIAFRKPIADAGRRAVELARQYAKPAAAIGTAGAVMSADDAEASPASAIAKRIARAYHGSPHKFDRFDMSKIGTGEGAQAYGHGLYFAEAEPVAQKYKNKLSSGTYTTSSGDIFDPYKSLEHLNVRVASQRSLDDAIERAFKLLQTQPENKDLITRDLNRLISVKEAGATPTVGHMYDVNINANPERFLDWDKAVGEQPKSVQEAIRYAFGPQHNDARLGSRTIDKPEPIHSRLLSEAGVPGIKYFDADSRSIGAGSRNYVIFDDKLIDINRRYADGGSVEQEQPGLVDRAMRFLSQFNPVGSAEASPASELAKRIVKKAVPKAEGTFKHPISGTKLITPIEEMRPVFGAPTEAITPRRPMDWSSTEGGVYMPATWDRSRGDRAVLKEINGQKLVNPQVMEGGPLYMNWGDLQPGKQVAASGSEIISRMGDAAAEAKKLAGDKDVYLANVLMGLEGADFSHMVANPLLDLARQRGFSKSEAALVDDSIRKALMQSLPSKAPIEKKISYASAWPGIMHPNLDELMWKMGGPYRSSIAKAMDTAAMKELGVPDVASIRYAATQPELLNSPNLSTGFSIAKVNPGAPAVSSGHTTYPVGLPGLGYEGGSQVDIPFSMFWRDFMKTRTPGENPSHTQRAFTMQMPVQKADPEWVDTISNYERDVLRGAIPPKD
jgi:hypothetical protein